MNDNKFSYIILDQNKSHMNEDSDFSENEYKKKSFKIQKYEKFKPKPIINKEKTNKTLKREENKVKDLLSMFLKNLESEENSSGFLYKPNNTLKMKDKDKDTISIKKKGLKKIKTVTNKNDINRTNSLIIKKDKFKDKFYDKLNIHKNFDNNKYMLGESTPKSSLFSNNIFHQKKVGFNLNTNNLSHNVNNNNDNHKEGILKKRSKRKYSLKVSNTLKNNKKINYIVQRTNSYTEINIKPLNIDITKGNINKNISNKRGNSTKTHLNNIRSKIKKTQSQSSNSYINFKNDNIVLNKNTNDKKKKRISFKNFINNLVSNNSLIKKNKNIVFNESNYNSMFSENSDCNINKKSIEIKTLNNNKTNESNKKDKNSIISSNHKKTSSIVKKEFSSILSKKNSIDLTDIINKNSIIKNTVKPKKSIDFKHPLENRRFFKRSETTINKNNFMNKSKYHRLNTHFNSLKEQLKKSIILRPDEINLSLEKEEKISHNSIKKQRNNSVSKKNNNNLISFKNKNSCKSNKNILNINFMSNINFGIITKQEMKKKNNSNKNIKLKDINQLSEHATSVKKLNIETEKQETEKLEKKESSKSASFDDDYSNNSIKRKNAIYYEKYRILTHKGIVYDSLDDEEFEDEEELNYFYLDPHSIFTITFDAILFISAIISLINIPLYLAMNLNFCRKTHISYVDGLNFFIECLNVIDLFLGFFRAYYNWEEQLIKKNRIIAFKYFTGWFIFDLLASIPVYTLIKINEPMCNDKEQSSSYYNIVLSNVHQLFINNRLFKIIKVFWNNQAWKILSNKINDNYSIIIYIFLVLTALNYTACLYIFIARNSYPNWIMHINFETNSFSDIYICAIYILIMALSTVGYGDITCYSFMERIFQLLLLVIGIMAYSWLVSSFSNYIKKINERSADYESRKSILDEIKLNNPNLPDSLYERILRYLKFKNFHEKKLKSIIFDCLPVGLKNNLISEMYKPIIKNFIFFKNFQNTDFIVRVILCFKPILAYKNDILVNEGDMLEDIMFVKRGVLSVELPINMTNPQENIDKYLNMPLLKIEKGPNVQKIGNSTIIPGNNPKFKNMINTINDKDNIKNKKLNSFNYSSTLGSSMKYTLSLGNKKILDKKKIIKKETTYVKILGIRENEHFGDVLMFLEQRSPLRVRVRSKKSELFFLKKMDAVKISTSYQNIWRRINKKSVFNFEQIKKSIRKIVEIYCSVRKINSLNDEENSNYYDNGLGTKESIVGVHPQNYDLNNSALNSKKEVILKKNKSLKNERIKNYSIFFKNEIINEDYFFINNDNINNNNKKCYSSRLLRKNLDINSIKKNKIIGLSSFSSSSFSSSVKNKNNVIRNDKNKKFTNKKLMDVFQGNYKYYRGITKNNNIETKEERQATIISEEPDKESSLTPLKYTNSLQKNIKISGIKRPLINSISVKKSVYEEDININPINEIVNEEEDLNNKNKSKIRRSSSSLIEWNKNNTSRMDNKDINEDNISNVSSYDKAINMEIYPGEIIEVNKEDNLLYKKIDFNIESDNNFNKINSNIEYKNTKLEKLLKSFEHDNYRIKINQKSDSEDKVQNNSDFSDINRKERYKTISDNNSNNSFTNRNNNLNIKEIDSSRNVLSSINNNIKTNWDSKILSINNSISLQLDSSYENFNLISGDLLIKNISLQTKLKNYLLNEISKFSRFNTNSNLLKKTNSLAIPMKFAGNKNMFQSTIRPNKRFSCSNIVNNNNFHIVRKKTKKVFGKNNYSMTKRAKTINSNSQSLERNSSFYDNNLIKNKKNKDKFKTGIGPEVFGNSIINNFGKKKTSNKGLLFKNTNNNNMNNYNIINAFNSSTKDLQKKIIRQRRNSIISTSFPKNKKKKDNLLSQININIQKTNQNLNNPDEFYSNYFSFLLEGEIGKSNQKINDMGFYTTSMMDMPKIKKERINRNKSYITKK